MAGSLQAADQSPPPKVGTAVPADTRTSRTRVGPGNPRDLEDRRGTRAPGLDSGRDRAPGLMAATTRPAGHPTVRRAPITPTTADPGPVLRTRQVLGVRGQ